MSRTITQKESVFQSRLKKEIEKALPGCLIFKMEQRQGIPDLLILHGDRWAALECKRSEKARHQPNQDWYVSKMNKMSFARFIYPENKEVVLDELFNTLKPGRKARRAKRK